MRYCETVTALSDQVCLAKSGNKLNRLYMTAQPLPEGLPEAIDEVCEDSFTALLYGSFNSDNSYIKTDTGPIMAIQTTELVHGDWMGTNNMLQ